MDPRGGEYEYPVLPYDAPYVPPPYYYMPQTGGTYSVTYNDVQVGTLAYMPTTQYTGTLLSSTPSFSPLFSSDNATFSLLSSRSGFSSGAGVTGGIGTEFYGGNSGQGFEQGAMMGKMGHTFNEGGGTLGEWWNDTASPWLKNAYSEHRKEQEAQQRAYVERMSRGFEDIAKVGAAVNTCGKAGACYLTPVGVALAVTGGSGGRIDYGIAAGAASAAVLWPIGYHFQEECAELFRNR